MYARHHFNHSIQLVICLMLLVFLQGFSSTVQAQEIPQAEYDALVALYNSTNGNGWVNNDNWLTTNPPSTWYGVTVQNGHVAYLTLNSNQLSGSIPPELSTLAYLVRLELNDNQLTGSIPLELTTMDNLDWLYLNKNQLSGNIPPELGNMTKLERLTLNNNQLTGSIPPELGNMDYLDYLHLAGNQLNGSIPLELGNMDDLQQLVLNNNQLTGGIPPELGNLANLDWLHLFSNPLGGSIPPELGNLTGLISLQLYSNQLTGSIPPELGNLTHLSSLYLMSNKLSGSIPPELGNMTNLKLLYLYNNQLSGSIPPELGNMTEIYHLWLHDNQLSGDIPPELGNLDNLHHLRLYNNNLSGFPPGLGNSASVYAIDISNNQLSGSIPADLGNAPKLYALYLNSNQLSGPVPPELGNSATLKSLGINDNPLLSGPLPMEWTNLPLFYFAFFNTDLCEPDDQIFQDWLSSISSVKSTGVICTNINNPPVAVCQDVTVSSGLNCTVDVLPEQVDNGSYDPDGDNITLSLDPAGPYPIGENPVSLTVSDGSFSASCEAIITVTGGSGSVAGTVGVNATGLQGITAKLLENETPTNIVAETVTDALGQYSFADMALDEYQVMIIVPLGYSVDQNFVSTSLVCGVTNVIDFNFSEIIVVNNARGKGYWKHQFDVYVKGRGNAQETEEGLNTFISEVHNRYDPRFNIFVDELSFEDWQKVLSVKGNAGMDIKAKSHIGALALNIMSQKIAQYEIVTEDNYTAGDVLTFVSELLLDSDPGNDELAKDLAECVNEQQMIAAGLVHPSQDILYKDQALGPDRDKSGVPAQFNLHQNYPNPFNPLTSISFDLPKETFVSLKIFDVRGRIITQLVHSALNAGHYKVEFDGSDLSSGIYYYTLITDEFRSVKKLILTK